MGVIFDLNDPKCEIILSYIRDVQFCISFIDLCLCCHRKKIKNNLDDSYNLHLIDVDVDWNICSK